jgi:saccharopine dehydrogenase-like NADP-dependent oxidoreductase
VALRLIVLASNNAEEANRLSARYRNVEAFLLDVSDDIALSEAVQNAEVVVR